MTVLPESEDFNPETTPTQDQRERLEDFLTELKLAGRSRDLLLVPWGGDIGVYDLRSRTMLAVGLAYILTTPLDGETSRVISLDFLDSVLDGAWLVSDADGRPIPQYLLNREKESS